VKRLLALTLLLGCLPPILEASAGLVLLPLPKTPEPPALKLSLTVNESKIPLTTERLWTLDPDQINPHRQRWIVQRETDLEGLTPLRHEDGRYGVMAASVRSTSTIFVRSAGPWYRPVEEFPCTQGTSSLYGNLAGSKKAGE